MLPSPASRTPRQDLLISLLAVLMVIAMMTLSTMALAYLGWNYDGKGDMGLTRFHPVTFLVISTLLVILLRDGNPLESFINAFRQDPRLALYFVAWCLLVFQTVMVQRLPATAPVDTFLVPLLMIMVYDRLDTPTRKVLAIIVHIGFIANAGLGLAEFLGGFRLTPFVVAGKEMPWDWRSSAFFGHPLGNALLTGCYAIILMCGGGKELKGLLRFGAIALQFAAMVAFGGRTSLVLLLAAGGIAVGWHALRFIAGGRANLLYLSLIGLMIPVGVAGIGALIDYGFFDKLVDRFISDGGSAKTRIVMLDMFAEFTWPELLFGPPQDRLAHTVNLYGLEHGIESMWVAFIYYFGILPSLLFSIGFLILLLALASRCDGRVWLVLLYFFLINSSFLGLAGKTILFAHTTMTLLILMPGDKPMPFRWRKPAPTPPSPAGAYAC